MLSRFLRDPLLHFLVFGGLLFSAYFALGKYEEQATVSGNRIVIDQAQLDHLTELWRPQWKRDPRPSDVAAIIDRHLRQEVFYREALKMNLDRDDQIIRKRLAQKMEAVANDLSSLMKPPTEARLRDYFLSRSDFFTLPRSYAFNQVLFLDDEADAGVAALAALRQGAPIPPGRQNKLSLPVTWSLTPVDELANAFGGDFVSALDALPQGEWSGTVRSGYGWHLVYIEERREPTLPAFEDVRDYVAREYEYQSVLEAQDQVYRNLLANYEVIITAEATSPGVDTGLAYK